MQKVGDSMCANNKLDFVRSACSGYISFIHCGISVMASLGEAALDRNTFRLCLKKRYVSGRG